MCEIRLCEQQLEELACRIAAKVNPPKVEPYTVTEASKILKVAYTTIVSRVNAGTIMRVPGLGKTIRIPRAEIDRLLAGEKKGGPK